MVLVQVPDGPLAQLPYRRQVTLLRELGYQFVAGGVVDHLVHVPDQAQHWFAVILPDTDRSGAQVLERRLRLGIGGYLSSRGLRLRDLESASLTAPDDDPAMGQIWEALIGPDEAHDRPALEAEPIGEAVARPRSTSGGHSAVSTGSGRAEAPEQQPRALSVASYRGPRHRKRRTDRGGHIGACPQAPHSLLWTMAPP